MPTQIKQHHFLLQLHPLQRILISMVVCFITLLIIHNNIDDVIANCIVGWCAFASCFVGLQWYVIIHKNTNSIKKVAVIDDGSKIYVAIFSILASFAAIVTVLLLIMNPTNAFSSPFLQVAICFLCVILSWLMLHTIFTFHYAHKYYSEDAGKNQALEFPDDVEPDYIDFAYFAFVIGMTFQVSDIAVNSKKMRRLVLVHSLISFLLNTFVVALTVNFIAGLHK